MPIPKLDLKGQKEKDKNVLHPQKPVKDTPEKKESQMQQVKSSKAAANASSPAKRAQGRPKGDPVVTRSLRIKEDINERLVKEQKLTGLSYNELANRAFDAYLK